MIRIRRITNLDVLVETVPKPKGAVPKFGLPKWKVMPLEQKIPMIPGPKGAYNFTRRKVGRKLWATTPRMEFDLNDPYCRESKFPYESLHDEHLLEFFSRPNNVKCLLKADLITDNMDAKCSFRDYNAYRKYLRNVHADCIRKELKKKNRLFLERKALRFAEDQMRKEAEKLKQKEELISAKQHIIQHRMLEQDLKILSQRQKMIKTEQRMNLFKLVKQKERALINVKRKERNDQLQEKRKTAEKITRKKIIGILVGWKEKEKARTKTKNKRLVDVEEQKRKTMEEKWIRKQNFQKRDITKQKILLQRINIRREEFIKNYNDKMNKEAMNLNRLLKNTKLFTNCYLERHLPYKKKRICCKKYYHDGIVQNADEKKHNIKNIKQDLTYSLKLK